MDDCKFIFRIASIFFFCSEGEDDVRLNTGGMAVKLSMIGNMNRWVHKRVGVEVKDYLDVHCSKYEQR